MYLMDANLSWADRLGEPLLALAAPAKPMPFAAISRFKFNDIVAPDKELEKLDAVVDMILAGRPKLLIVGHTDPITPPDPGYNIALGSRRAAEMKRLLNIRLERRRPGSSRAVIYDLRSSGAADPAASNATEKGREQNRRVEIFFPAKSDAKIPVPPHQPPPKRPRPPEPPKPERPGPQRPPYSPPVYHPPGPVVPWPGNAQNQRPARDTGHSPWVWDALRLAASGLGLTISAGIMALNSDILGKAIGVAQFALGIKGLEARALIGLAGEMVAESILEDLLGSSGRIFNLNEIRPNFPLIDLITSTESPSVKTFGILTGRNFDEVRSDLLRAFKQGTGRDWPSGSRFRKLTQAAQALLDTRSKVPAGALPEAVRLAKSVADVEAHVKKTFTLYVPADFAEPLRRSVTELVAREIGVEVTVNRKYFAGRKMTTADAVLIQSNLERVRSLSLTSSDLRILVEVGADLRRAGKGAKRP